MLQPLKISLLKLLSDEKKNIVDDSHLSDKKMARLASGFRAPARLTLFLTVRIYRAMRIDLPNGKYVLAVSGGVDSMVLLDLLAKKPGMELIVAHFNHGIRTDAKADEALVSKKAREYGLPVEIKSENLGEGASEEAARKARYQFLYKTQAKHAAKAIITAHHQDDLIETAFLNLLRGTGPKGLVAIMINKKIKRPFIKYSKSDILEYAKRNNLKWNEDSSNQDNNYARNYIRNNILVHLKPNERRKIIGNIEKVAKIEEELNDQIAKLSQILYKNTEVYRQDFYNLPVEIGNELLAHWLRALKVSNFDRRSINRLNTQLRTSRAGTEQDVNGDLRLRFGQKTARFIVSGE